MFDFLKFFLNKEYEIAISDKEISSLCTKNS